MPFFIPIFPLQLVAYPGEKLSLHIFEPRYKQMINDCIDADKPFGICTSESTNIKELGTLLHNIQVLELYENGSMDITAEGQSVFTVLEFIKEVPEKLYQGAVVNLLQENEDAFKIKKEEVITLMRKLHKAIGFSKNFNKEDLNLQSFDVAHYVGFTLQEEYEMLSIPQESQRWEYILRHLKGLEMQWKDSERSLQNMSVLENIERNGYFISPN